MRFEMIGLVLVLGLVVGLRVSGPGDLDSKDQPKTVSYTADIVENGNWVWPHDMMGRPATKPPMYNRIGAVAVMVLGTSEFVLKLPTLLATAGVLAMMFVFFGIVNRRGNSEDVSLAGDGIVNRAIYAAMCFVSCITVYGLVYTARPDMLFAAWLFVGWVCATLLLCGIELGKGQRYALIAVLWLAFAGAMLAKGPAAVLLVIYMFAAGEF